MNEHSASLPDSLFDVDLVDGMKEEFIKSLESMTYEELMEEIEQVRDYLNTLLDEPIEPMPMTLKTPPYCVNCSSHPNNGGNGICFCTLGSQDVSGYL